MKNIIKYKGIALDEAFEIVEEIVQGYGGANVDVGDNSISVQFYEFSNLFQVSEIYGVMCNGGLYEEEYELKEDSCLECRMNILFYEDKKEIEVYSWHELVHFIPYMDNIEFDYVSEYQDEILEAIKQKLGR